MTRNHVIALISEILSIKREYITEESNLMLLFILSDYLDKQSKVKEHSYKISKLGLKKKNPIDIQQKNREIAIDIDFLFEDNDNINIQYRSERGSRGLDSFYGYQLIQLYFVLEIESKLGIQINDEIWEQIETVGALLQAIKDEQQTA
jgi:acyl carrier protein